MINGNNQEELTSKKGAYGNVVVDDKTLINAELSYIEDNKSMLSYNKPSMRIEKQTSNISKIKENLKARGAYSEPNNDYLMGKTQGRNPQYYYEDEIILEEWEKNDKQNENLIVNEVKNNFIEKVKKINNDFLTVSNNAKKHNDYLHDKYNIPKNVNDEFLNSSNFIKIMCNNKSGKMPPKLFSGPNNSNHNMTNNKSLMIQESNIIDEITNKSRMETSKLYNNVQDGFEDYFNIVPDNSMMNISAFTNNIVMKENSQIYRKMDPKANGNYLNNISNISKILNDIPESNLNAAKFAIKTNNEFDVIHDSIIGEFENTMVNNTIIHNQMNKSLEIPKADEKDQSFMNMEEPMEPELEDKEPELENKEPELEDKEPELIDKEPELEDKEPELEDKEPELEDKEPKKVEEEPEVDLVMAERPASPEQNNTLIQSLEKVEEPKKVEESFFQETFFEENKEKYTEFNSLIEDEKPKFPVKGPNLSFKKDKNSLYELYGKHVLFTWAEVTFRKKAKIKQGIKDDRFFTNAFLEDQQAIDFKNKLATRDFINELDSFAENIQHISESCEGKDFFEINDLFKIQQIPTCELKQIEGRNVLVDPKYDWGNNANFLEEKRILFETLIGRLKKTVFNKVSFLYDAQVLKQKYSVCNENLDYESAKEEEIKDGVFLAKEELEKFCYEDDNLDPEENKNLIFNNYQEKNKNGHLDKKDNDQKVCLWRESLCDGNSYYRMFILAYFEHLIMSQQLELLAKMFVHIYKVYQNLYLINQSKKLDNEKYIFYKINLKIVLMIFNFIINMMRLGDYATAYKIMLNAFNLEDGSFDRIVIGYMRLNVLDYLYFIIRNDNGLKKRGLKEKITKKMLFTNFTFSYIEPEEVILDLTAKIYNVNINLFYVDGSINNGDQKKFVFGKKTYFGNEENKDRPKINLFYNLNCYFKFYTLKEYKENVNVLKRFVSKVKEITIIDGESPCKICQKVENNKKIYFKNQLICACVECIRGIADSIINSRFFNYQKDEFLSREYYCKPLNILKQITIEDSVYIQLFGKNIWNELMQRINNCCSKCNAKSEKLYETRTNLNYCKECLLGLINDFTDNVVVLNDFEKRKMIKKHPELPTILDLDESINLLQLESAERTAGAEQRLKNTYETLCCECTENKKTLASQPNESSFIKFYKIDIYDKDKKELEISSKSKTQSVHIICASCVQKHKSEIDSKKAKENNSNNDDAKNAKSNSIPNNTNSSNTNKNSNTNNINNVIEFGFMCEICDKKHMTIMKLDDNAKSKKACCAGCSIF